MPGHSIIKRLGRQWISWVTQSGGRKTIAISCLWEENWSAVCSAVGLSRVRTDLCTRSAEAVGVLCKRHFSGVGPKEDESLSTEESKCCSLPQHSVCWAVVAVSKQGGEMESPGLLNWAVKGPQMDAQATWKTANSGLWRWVEKTFSVSSMWGSRQGKKFGQEVYFLFIK